MSRSFLLTINIRTNVLARTETRILFQITFRKTVPYEIMFDNVISRQVPDENAIFGHVLQHSQNISIYFK
jgi:hypothetical protein